MYISHLNIEDGERDRQTEMGEMSELRTILGRIHLQTGIFGSIFVPKGGDLL